VHPAVNHAKPGEQIQVTCKTMPELQVPQSHAVEWEFLSNGTNDRMGICYSNIVRSDLRGKYQCRTEAHRHTLMISNVSVKDSGTYTCIEDEGRGPGVDSSLLMVYRE